jgi:Ca-activated chloride channel homolog
VGSQVDSTTSPTVLYSFAIVRTSSLAAGAAVLFSVCAVGIAFQAPRSRPVIPPADLRVDSSLVLIPVHVTTPGGASVASLSRDSFQLFEDGVEQRITLFAKEDAPLSVGVLFDASGSMQNKIRKSSEAAATFFKTANVDDEFFLVEFNDRAKLTVPFTSDSDEIYQRIAHTKAFGRTSLLDAIHLAAEQMKHARNLRKALVIFSDGGDNRSRYTASEVRNAMLESDVQVYAMGIFNREDPRKLTREEQNGPRLLNDLAEQTGGRQYPVGQLDDLSTISARISDELRNQYMLGYSPQSKERDGRYRQIKVNLTAPPEMPDLKAYYRHGYYAPVQ